MQDSREDEVTVSFFAHISCLQQWYRCKFTEEFLLRCSQDILFTRMGQTENPETWHLWSKQSQVQRHKKTFLNILPSGYIQPNKTFTNNKSAFRLSERKNQQKKSAESTDHTWRHCWEKERSVRKSTWNNSKCAGQIQEITGSRSPNYTLVKNRC